MFILKSTMNFWSILPADFDGNFNPLHLQRQNNKEKNVSKIRHLTFIIFIYLEKDKLKMAALRYTATKEAY